jgi:hypothetical protein
MGRGFLRLKCTMVPLKCHIYVFFFGRDESLISFSCIASNFLYFPQH